DAAYYLAAGSQSVRHYVRRAVHERHELRSFNRPRHTKFLTPPGWLNRFRRLARDYERPPETLAGLHFVVFAMLMLVHAVPVLQSS
ncbi:hypothetical protein ACLFKU_42410, partial [Paraburkholderia sp. EG304]